LLTGVRAAVLLAGVPVGVLLIGVPGGVLLMGVLRLPVLFRSACLPERLCAGDAARPPIAA
jgi:hypothetical protein